MKVTILTFNHDSERFNYKAAASRTSSSWRAIAASARFGLAASAQTKSNLPEHDKLAGNRLRHDKLRLQHGYYEGAPPHSILAQPAHSGRPSRPAVRAVSCSASIRRCVTSHAVFGGHLKRCVAGRVQNKEESAARGPPSLSESETDKIRALSPAAWSGVDGPCHGKVTRAILGDCASRAALKTRTARITFEGRLRPVYWAAPLPVARARERAGGREKKRERGAERGRTSTFASLYTPTTRGHARAQASRRHSRAHTRRVSVCRHTRMPRCAHAHAHVKKSMRAQTHIHTHTRNRAQARPNAQTIARRARVRARATYIILPAHCQPDRVRLEIGGATQPQPRALWAWPALAIVIYSAFQ